MKILNIIKGYNYLFKGDLNFKEFMNKFISITKYRQQIIKINYTILGNKETNGIINPIRKNTFSLFPNFIL